MNNDGEAIVKPKLMYWAIGNGDHTPLTRPFTANSPHYHFTVGEKNYRLRFLEERSEEIGCSWVQFKTNDDAHYGFFDLLNEDGSLVKIRWPEDEDTFDDHLEAIKNAILPMLQRVFKDMPGQLDAINFQNGEEIDDEDHAANHVPSCGHVFYWYPEDLPQEPS